MLQKMMTADEVAEVLSISKARVYDLTRQKLIPSVRLGREVRFSPDALRAWIDQGGQALPGGWKQREWGDRNQR